MYRVVQVLNNNVAIVKNQFDEQSIAMGKGLVFQKKKGDLITEEAIQNLFVLKNDESKENLYTLLKDVPLDFITTTYEIIDNAIKKYNYPVQEYIYVTLTDHIFWGYQRLIKNEYQRSLLPEMEGQYPVEYAIAKDALMILKQHLALDFPKEEIKSIALHFINAKGKTEKYDKTKIDKKQITLDEVSNILERENISRNNHNQNFYDRLMIHLRYMLEREEKNIELDEFTKKMDKELQQNYPKAYKIAEEIYQVIVNKMGVKLSSNEKVYLTIHIQRII
ncbi:PRD domain-containing protein [Enterococcus sp. AZ103]|uniref:PRD domain-containing protein n=1 Tax=Enterococcus sp. AZ103 TaxID=2774628 RepID=UPI003F20B4C7